MRTRQTVTISLPPEMALQVEQAMREENRTRSELVREALRTYMAIRRLPEEQPAAAERRAIRQGRAAFMRGDYVTLDSVGHSQHVARRPRQTSSKSA